MRTDGIADVILSAMDRRRAGFDHEEMRRGLGKRRSAPRTHLSVFAPLEHARFSWRCV